MDTTLYKDTKSQRGFAYHYLSVSPQGSKPTILFLHGFPSTSNDWRNQVAFFRKEGYGLIVPDLLGYGGTDKPTGPKEFRLSSMANDVVDILDAEHLDKVFVVGHDWCAI
jgi:soluble epoxide hydrolase/lipid-phosphate phosphatase